MPRKKFVEGSIPYDPDDVFPGKVGLLGVALSYMEVKHRYGVDYHLIDTWVKKGTLNVAGVLGRGEHWALPLVWSKDVESAIAREGYHPTRPYRRWETLVRREYALRGLREPPSEALDMQKNEECTCTKACCRYHEGGKR